MKNLLENKNRKGQFLMFGIFAIIAAIVLVLIFVSSKFRFMLIGGLLFFVMVSILLKGDLNKTKGIFCVVLFAGSMFFLFGAGLLQTSFAPTFTPIFCNDYEFTCCNQALTYTQPSFKLTGDDIVQCPLTATKCTVTKQSGSNEFWVGENCVYTGWLLGWDCNPRTRRSVDVFDIYPGQYVMTSQLVYSYVKIETYGAKLSFCGKSGCSVGVKVSGADQCKFNPQGGVIYTSTNALAGKVSATSYTVPLDSCILAWQSGDRHICGYKEESCSSNLDCGGHTYGNKECTGRTLQTYGCNSYGNTIIGGDRAPSSSGWGTDASQNSANTYGKRCEIQSAVTVQCCGDTDCGSNQFCDKTSWTCKTNVQCTQNSDCGVSTQCDFTTKQLKTPKCSSGQCTYTTKNVECCDNSNCLSTQFCNVDKKCETSTPGLQICPFDCCISDSRYVDKLCPSDKPYCVTGSCKIKPDGQTPAEKEAACNLKATQQPLMGWAWTTVEKQTIWSLIGIGKPRTEAYCKASFLIYWIVGGIILFTMITIIIIVASKNNNRNRYKYQKRSRRR